MGATATGTVLRAFADLPDPRTGNHVPHGLHDLIVIALMAVICGADGWVQVRLWARSKATWLGTFLELPGGIPSHDTFGRVFALLDPAAFERAFTAWMGAVVALSDGRLVALDGKAIRGSFERAWDRSGMAHLVSAFVSQGDNRLVFARAAVEEKANEIVAIPKLLALLDLKGAVVTIDAMGCRREAAAAVVDGGGDYLLPVKKNQPELLGRTAALMDDLALDHAKGTPGTPVDLFEASDDGHGRLERRRVWVTTDVRWLGAGLLGKWPGLASVALVERRRQDLGDFSGKVTVERQVYISSLTAPAAATVAGYARGHWSVENNLHWQLDVSFAEDDRRLRVGHGAENFSRLCRAALNLLKQDTSVEAGVKSKRLLAGWDHDFLLRLIQQ